jgi:hypothetical protein
MNVKIEESKQPDQFNWDKPQLLETKDEVLDHILVYFSPEMDPKTPGLFNALELSTGKLVSFLKEEFKPFNGTVTLSND